MQHGDRNGTWQLPYENAVFVSYKWGGNGEEIVNLIDQALQIRGIKLIRDKRDLPYKGSIRTFMERLGHGNCVILIINDEYLRSRHCMFELLEIAEAEKFHDRVFPVVLSDASIYDPVRRIEYVRYWEAKRAELAEAMRTLDPANLQGIREDMDLYDRIRDRVSGLTSTLRDMNTLSPDIHKEAGYQILVDAIAERLQIKDPGSKDQSHQKRTIDRRLNAPIPNERGSGQTTDGGVRKISPAGRAAIWVFAAIVLVVLIGIGRAVFERFKSTPISPSPMPFCIGTGDILVKVHVLGSTDEELATLIPGGTFTIDPGSTVFFQVELTSIDGVDLPAVDCAWVNAGRATDGKLLHNAGCRIDYQGGREKVTDALSLQLSQPSCSALPPYAFFISSR